MSKKNEKIDDKQLKSVTKDAVKAAVKSERKKLTKAVEAAEAAAERAEKAAAQATGRAKSAKKAKKAAAKAWKKVSSRSCDHEPSDHEPDDHEPSLEAERPAASVDAAESTESVVPEAAPLKNVSQDATLTEGSAKVAGDPLAGAPASDAHVGLTRAQLIVLAGEQGVLNRTRLTKAQLLEALQTS